MGFDISLNVGEWRIWGNTLPVTANSTHVTIDETIVVHEGDVFTLTHGANDYRFKLKEKFSDTVIIQPTDSDMIFDNFGDGGVATATARSIISDPSSGRPVMTANGTAVWMSAFGSGDEYKLLAKAAIASKVKSWYTRNYAISRDRVAAPYFATLCCDMPEPAEIDFILWYVY